jgi:hypothetical protein
MASTSASLVASVSKHLILGLVFVPALSLLSGAKASTVVGPAFHPGDSIRVEDAGPRQVSEGPSTDIDHPSAPASVGRFEADALDPTN